MDADAQLIGKVLRVLVLAFVLRAAIEALDLRGPDPKGSVTCSRCLRSLI